MNPPVRQSTSQSASRSKLLGVAGSLGGIGTKSFIRFRNCLSSADIQNSCGMRSSQRSIFAEFVINPPSNKTLPQNQKKSRPAELVKYLIIKAQVNIFKIKISIFKDIGQQNRFQVQQYPFKILFFIDEKASVMGDIDNNLPLSFYFKPDHIKIKRFH